MKRIAGIGDNTLDVYRHLGLFFPGGNAVNVAVLARRLGYGASYLGRVGHDLGGQVLQQALQNEHIDLSRLRIANGSTAWSLIDLVDGDRVFSGNHKGVSVGWCPNQQDLEFLAQHQAVHSSVYSRLESSLEAIRSAAPIFTFDFSSEWNPSYLEQVAPYLDLAFLSAPQTSEQECRELARWVASLGPRQVILTRGAAGSLAYDGNKLYQQGIIPTNVIDTLGAGDAFIAAYLTAFLEDAHPALALAHGAQQAALNCQLLGAFGHGRPIEAALLEQIEATQGDRP
jgi:fructoselysine 6-kinase